MTPDGGAGGAGTVAKSNGEAAALAVVGMSAHVATGAPAVRRYKAADAESGLLEG